MSVAIDLHNQAPKKNRTNRYVSPPFISPSFFRTSCLAHSIELAHRACEHSPNDAHDVKGSAIFLCRS